MAEPVEKARRQSTIEDRIEDEFQRAVGGIPAIERMREEIPSYIMPILHRCTALLIVSLMTCGGVC
jgi:hypothetical protein